MRKPACVALVALIPLVIYGQTSGMADIRASAPNTMPNMRTRFNHSRYELKNATVVDLIRTAWTVDADHVLGGPEWMDLDRFDVVAAAPQGSTVQTFLQGFLKERFHLVVEEASRDLPAYAITAGRKLQLKKADGAGESGCRVRQNGSTSGKPTIFDCTNITMGTFAGAIRGMRGAADYLFNYPVVDRTGLKGGWNFTVQWSLRPAAAETVTIFDAFEKQLGLKLALVKVPTRVVLVENVGKPVVSQEPKPSLEFEVADIRQNAQLVEGSSVNIQPGGLVRINMTLRGLIQEAWGDLNPWPIVGGPKSMDAVSFAIIAKASAQEDAPPGWNGAVWNGVDIDSMRMMVRAMLVDRFHLVTHTEERQMPGYALVPARPRLKKADPANRPGCREGPGADGKDPRLTNPMASRLLTCRNMTMAQFAARLHAEFGYPPVVDATGIAGSYDMTINFSRPAALKDAAAPTTSGEAVASEPNGAISVFEALERQLGLKLESRKVTAQVLVIDHVDEMPTAN